MKTLANPRFLPVFVLILIAVATSIPYAYSSTLTLTVFTTEPSYKIGEDINVYGSLKYDDSPVPLWPVAVEIQDPIGTLVVTRSLQTDVNGAYTLTFKLPTNARLGTYTVYVSAGYKGETASNQTTFVLHPSPDIAVTDIAVSDMRLVEGYDLSISIIVANQGVETEVFAVTAFLNGRPVESFQNVLLDGGKTIALDTAWGPPRGWNTISVYITPVPLEIDILDNTLNTGTILVSPFPRGRNLGGPFIQL